ncbi:branched-chain amino acid aminotransferase [Robiginitalea sediminis]|uniref:branched-chain amino acid aminotransferase n=1 Tax=Robiginitalea sediminis TaxID=1982593 RepID=UPI000B4BA4F4|nr:branched-chain amino acid aminotransferase [Robiginitalea sediminis]
MEFTTKTIPVEKTSASRLAQVDFNNLSFGGVFTDHMFICEYKNGAWQDARVIPYGPLSLEPAAKVFHYGQEVFEGMKAYKDAEGKIWLFRPLENQRRLNRSAARLAIPEVPEAIFMEGLKTLLQVDSDWIPTQAGSSLYIRPFIFASGTGFHASPSDAYTFIIACAPSGAYFSGEVSVRIEETYSRAANGGVGYAKAGGNYAGQFYPTKLAQEAGFQQVVWTDDHTHEYIEEAGAMNIFIRIGDTLLTSPTSDRILDGITRKSILTLAEAEGIPTEVRKIKVSELVEASRQGTLLEMFGAGTAAVVSPISSFGYRDQVYTLPKPEKSYAAYIKERITDIQYNRAEDPFGWRYPVGN